MNKLFNRYRIIWIVFLLFICTACQKPFQIYNEKIDLSGIWRFQLDSANMGIQEKWFNTVLNDSLKLPGTTDENKKGIFLDEKAIDRLSRVWYWKGAAWPSDSDLKFKLSTPMITVIEGELRNLKIRYLSVTSTSREKDIVSNNFKS